MNQKSIAERVAHSALADLTWDDAPKVKEQEFDGSTVRGRDRFHVTLESGLEGIGSWSKFAVRVFNPNRGTTFFQIEDEADLDKLEKSFASALQGVRKAIKEHNKEMNDFFKKLEEEHKAKKGQP